MVVMFFTFLPSNWPTCAGTWRWLMRGAAACSAASTPPSHRFNAGEKVVFWGGMLVLACVVVVSGSALDKIIPGLASDAAEMQVVHIVPCRLRDVHHRHVHRPHLHRARSA